MCNKINKYYIEIVSHKCPSKINLIILMWNLKLYKMIYSYLKNILSSHAIYMKIFNLYSYDIW